MTIKLPTSIAGYDGKAEYERIVNGKEEEPIANPVQHSNVKDTQDFIYVPSINLYVARERTFLNETWTDCHKLLQAEEERMLILPEFIEFLKYCKINNPDIYEEITAIRSPWRAEWIDADFKVKGKDLHINYNHILDSSGNPIPKNSEILDKNTLMEDKNPGISLEDYLNNNHTNQGLPNKSIHSGDLYYWYPRSDNNSVAWFSTGSDWTYLLCYRNPSSQYPSLGVRAAKQRA